MDIGSERHLACEGTLLTGVIVQMTVFRSGVNLTSCKTNDEQPYECPSSRTRRSPREGQMSASAHG